MEVKILGVGSYLPTKILTNDELSQSLDTSDEWIFSRVGIKQRHIASPSELTSDLATEALKQALENSKLDCRDLDGIILATTTPDLYMPATATKVQANLKIKKGFAFDIQAACSGFIYAMNIAYSMIKSSQAKRIAVIGAETMSRIVDWKDRSTCVLFGDGAGAFILGESDNAGIMGIDIASDGSYLDILKTPGGIASGNLGAKLEMSGNEVFKFAVVNMMSSLEQLIKNVNILKTQIDWIIPHQANCRIIGSIQQKLDFPIEKFAMSIDKHANTSAASIPITFSDYHNKGLIKRGDLCALIAVGAGMTSGSAIFHF